MLEGRDPKLLNTGRKFFKKELSSHLEKILKSHKYKLMDVQIDSRFAGVTGRIDDGPDDFLDEEHVKNDPRYRRFKITKRKSSVFKEAVRRGSFRVKPTEQVLD